MRLALLAVLLAAAAPSVRAQPASARALIDAAAQAGAIADPAARAAAVSALWTSLRPGQATSRVPYVAGDTAVFVWRGTASTVSVAGDHTGWSPTAAALARQGQSDLWLRMDRLDAAARVDYKIVVNGSDWRLDAANPFQQSGGAGPNSELRMPLWRQEPLTVRVAGVPQGALGAAQTLSGTGLPAAVVYRVWTPAGYAASADRLPAVYVTDGHEYADDALGAMRTVLDNAIAQGLIEPCVVVFIDPRDGGTSSGQNRRQELYVNNAAYATFVADRLVPAIDAAYRTRPDRDSRVILGTSLGGLFSAYLGATHPDVFGRLAIHSPAFWISENAAWGSGPTIYTLMQQAAPGMLRIAMTAGTIRDTQAEAQRMRTILVGRGQAVTYLEVPEGHSWGNWRAHIDDVLIPLIPGRAVASEPTVETGALRVAPAVNPSADPALRVTLAEAATVAVRCSDALGRAVVATVDTVGAGEHVLPLGVPDLAAGVYVCRVTAGRASASATLTVVR